MLESDGDNRDSRDSSFPTITTQGAHNSDVKK